VDEPGSVRAWAIVEQRQPLWTSEFAAAEVASALSRLVRTGQLNNDTAADALTDFARWRFEGTSDVPIGPTDIRLAHAFVRRFDTQLRTPDALHLALAQRLGAAFATFDLGASRAASMLDLQVVT
jgi:uncharacterized protein